MKQTRVFRMIEGDPITGTPVIAAKAEGGGVQAPAGRPVDPSTVTRPTGYEADADTIAEALERLARREIPAADGSRLMRAVEAWLSKNGYVIVRKRPSQAEVQDAAQKIANTINRRKS